MLHCRDQNFVSRTNLGATVGLRYQVDSLRRTANKNDLARLLSIKERLHRRARRFVLFRRVFREEMYATMDVGVAPLVVTGDGINNHLWLLRCGRVIQVNQRSAADLLPENGKVMADLLHVEPCTTHAR